MDARTHAKARIQAATSALTSTVNRGLLIGELPSGHAGAARKGCVFASAFRFNRRSRIYRPTICALGSASDGVVCIPLSRSQGHHALGASSVTLDMAGLNGTTILPERRLVRVPPHSADTALDGGPNHPLESSPLRRFA